MLSMVPDVLLLVMRITLRLATRYSYSPICQPDGRQRRCRSMLKPMKLILIASILVLQVLIAASAKSAYIATIAPDLKVVSAEFGAFPADKGPAERKGKDVVFKKTNHVKKVGFSYGWRIKLDTPRKSVRVYEIWDNRESKPGKGESVEIVDGYIYQDWDVVMGTRKGKHTVEVFLEGVPVKKFVYFVH